MVGSIAFLFLDLSIAQKNRNAIKIRLQYGNNSVTNNSESLTTGTTVTGGENRTAENGTPQENTVSNSTGVDSIQGATITRVTEGNLVKVTDDRNVAWSPMDFEVQSASAKIDGEKSKVTI